MKLDYISDINEYEDKVMRLYDFDNLQASSFRESLRNTILANKAPLNLSVLNFIEPGDCTLTLRISDEDTGIVTADDENFFCDLTIAGYENMVLLLAPFCKRNIKGFQYLYDIDNPIDFVFSPAGTEYGR